MWGRHIQWWFVRSLINYNTHGVISLHIIPSERWYLHISAGVDSILFKVMLRIRSVTVIDRFCFKFVTKRFSLTDEAVYRRIIIVDEMCYIPSNSSQSSETRTLFKPNKSLTWISLWFVCCGSHFIMSWFTLKLGGIHIQSNYFTWIPLGLVYLTSIQWHLIYLSWKLLTNLDKRKT